MGELSPMNTQRNRNGHILLPVYCSEAEYAPILCELLNPSFSAILCRSWQEFLRRSERAQCSVIECESLTDPNSFRNLFTFCSYPTLRPVVLTTQLSPANAKALKDLCVDEVVGLNEVERELLTAVKRAVNRSLLALVSRDILRSERLPTHLGRALSAACSSPFAIRSQKELALLAQCDRSTLIRQWNLVLANGPSLKDGIDWLLLLKAFSFHRGGKTWTWVASKLDIDSRTLSSIAKRLTGRSLSRLSEEQLLTNFRRDILSHF